MSCGLEVPAGFIIDSNRRCSSVMETQFSDHHRRLILETLNSSDQLKYQGQGRVVTFG